MKLNQKNNQPKTLSLAHNELSKFSAMAIGSVLQLSNVKLKILDVSYNYIDDAGAGEISKGIKINGVLISLNLCANNLYNEGGQFILEAMKVNKHIEKINLNKNLITERVIKAINDLLRANEIKGQKQKIPGFLREIKSFPVNSETINEIYKQSQNILEQQQQLKQEIDKYKITLHSLEIEETKDRALQKKEYEKLVEYDSKLDAHIDEYENSFNEVRKNSDSIIKLILKKTLEAKKLIAYYESILKKKPEFFQFSNEILFLVFK